MASLAYVPILILNAFAMASSPIAHVPSVSHLPLPIPSNPPIYLHLQNTNANMISKEIIRLSNRITDLPEEIHISIIVKLAIEM